jgi:hypothetical protein
VLHYVEDKYEACRRLQNATRVGGINAVSLWSDYTPVPACHEIVPTFPDAEYGAVYEAYRGWEKSLLYFERRRAEMGHDDMPHHEHSFIKLVARRVGSRGRSSVGRADAPVGQPIGVVGEAPSGEIGKGFDG